MMSEIQQQNKRINHRSILKVVSILTLMASCQRLSTPRGGFGTSTIIESNQKYNVRIKVVNVTTGELLKGVSIVTKNGNKLDVVQSSSGVQTLTIPSRKTWFRTAMVGFRHNEFVIKPDQSGVLEVTSYQIPDDRPLKESAKD